MSASLSPARIFAPRLPVGRDIATIQFLEEFLGNPGGGRPLRFVQKDGTGKGKVTRGGDKEGHKLLF
jgi:hypothetical protein